MEFPENPEHLSSREIPSKSDDPAQPADQAGVSKDMGTLALHPGLLETAHAGSADRGTR